MKKCSNKYLGLEQAVCIKIISKNKISENKQDFFFFYHNSHIHFK